jgi:hypothetical protein
MGIKICIAHYKAGENTATLWRIGEEPIYLYANFRAHGHGELDIMAKRAGGEWEDICEGMNANFGRGVDRLVQKLGQKPAQPILFDIAKAFEVEVKDEDAASDFRNDLGDILFQPIYEGVSTIPSERLKKMVEGMKCTQEQKEYWLKSAVVGDNVMCGPDYVKILEARETPEENGVLGWFLAEFGRDALCYGNDNAMKEMALSCIRRLGPVILDDERFLHQKEAK